MTPRTPQCKVFWALLSNPKHSGVPKDSKSPTLGVLGFTPTLGQSGVATLRDDEKNKGSNYRNEWCIEVKMHLGRGDLLLQHLESML